MTMTEPTRLANRRLTIRRALAAGVACVALAACATTYIMPTTTTNPPPSEKLAGFSSFELQPIALAAAYQGSNANDKAAAKIQEHLTQRLNPLISAWKRESGANARTLVISPRIEHIKFIGGGARFWAGALAGSSAVIMKVRLQDKATGQVIAEPEFFQRAAAMSGSWTIGGQDNAMLSRVADLISNYLSGNYDAAVGGPSGATEEFVKG